MLQSSFTVWRSDAKPQSRKATRSMWLQVSTVKLKCSLLKHALLRHVSIELYSFGQMHHVLLRQICNLQSAQG